MEISSRKNAAVRLFRELCREKRARAESGLFAAEGDHLCGELARAGFKTRLALWTARAEEKYPETVRALRDVSEECAVITEELAEYISDTKAPQGIFAAAEIPRATGFPDNARRLVLLDGVQDPGNVGTVIRTAEALGIDGAALSEDCADIWSPKTIRASMGSVFRLPCITGSLSDTITTLKENGFSVRAAALDAQAARLGEFSFPEKSAVVIGSEGSGVSPRILELCEGTIYIPISGAESLNAAAAAAIILWELAEKGLG